MKLQLAVVGLLFGTVLTVEWNYNLGQPGGPDDWVSISGICDDQSQSPINIDTNQVCYDENLVEDKFHFDNYDSDDIDINLKNTGHTVELTFKDGESLLTGGNLPEVFSLFQIHFHWGSQSNQGSEHSVNNKFFPMEMHMVHHNTQFPVAQSVTTPGGLAVLGFFFEISSKENSAFKNIVNNLKNVIHEDDEVKIPTVIFADLMPDNLEDFYRYQGSLTTPNCYETVTWTVFRSPIPISEGQMEEFRKVLEGGPGSSHFISNNFRPRQNLNGRTVYTSDPWEGQFDILFGSSHLQDSLICLHPVALSMLVVRRNKRSSRSSFI